ncbi:DHA1 family bicyclomycin/chloramphenicol resistance-like MFS transporter [Salsuginibacillus halophilus]|uniref:Bcr/CflA family efflux transporter n=1 Tax=Salsuginibacillus halophilus TaxID=517424 RepID=A0A2P8HEC2_9BACI|nr:Bcr/CflA family efflux MFS transporter [Salsuginibacillus halophilus]PSL44559.1 DHA1 family bicyclomycin/chloramphenicol resistance-like MFS transporter [Salsuginibacillus halophilus]
MMENPEGKQRLGLAVMLSMLAVLGPLNIDMYLPAFPEIAEDLGAEVSIVQASLTACLIGLAAGQLVIGPMSDARGRRKPLLLFISLFAAASVLCAVAPSIEWLIIGRFIQGFTAAAGIVLSRAVVRDVFSGKELTKFFSLLMVINATAPLVAPLAGGGLLWFAFADWRTIFFVLALIGVAIVIVVYFRLEETLPVERRMPSSLGHSLRTMRSLSTDRSFIGYALALGFVHGGSFAYVSGTPFVYQDIYGVSPQMFSVLFGINGIAIILGSFSIGRLAGIVSEQKLLRTAVLIAISASGFLFIMTLVEGPLASLVVPIFIYMTGMGMVLTSSFTVAISKQGHRAGSASALLGMFPLLIGALVSPLAGINEASAVPMGFIMFSTTVIGAVALFTLSEK